MESLDLRFLAASILVTFAPARAWASFITAPDYVHVGDAVSFDYQIRDQVLATTPVLLPTGVQFLGGDVVFDSNGPSTPSTASVPVSGFASDVSAAFTYTDPGVYRATVGGAVQTEVLSSIGALTTTYTFTPADYSPFVVVVPLGDPIPTDSLLTGPTHAGTGEGSTFQTSMTALIAKFIAEEQPLYPGLTFEQLLSVDLSFDPGGPSSTGSQAWQSKTDPSFTTSYADPGFFYATLSGRIDAVFRQCLSIACLSPFPLTLDVSETHLIAVQSQVLPEPAAGVLLSTSLLAWAGRRASRRSRK